MNQQTFSPTTADVPAERASVEARADFLLRTYAHLFGAMALFVLLEYVLIKTGVAAHFAPAMSQSWLLVLGGFMLVSWLASSVAHKARSKVSQYAALAGFVAMEAVVFLPLLYIATSAFPGVTTNAAILTLGGFAGLTMIVFWTRKDFSFLGGILRWVGFAALGLIVAFLLVPSFDGGVWFPWLMVVFAGGAVLYDTSNVLHHYPTDRHVAASLSLFASIALLFWYVLQILMSAQRD